jgi:hypothetical protein
MLDAAEQLPKAAQWAAGKVSPMLEKAGAGLGPYAKELAQRAPQVLQSLVGQNEPKKSKPYEKEEILQKTQGTKYANTLNQAAQRGEQAFNATYFVLQNNPEFRAAMKTDEAHGE